MSDNWHQLVSKLSEHLNVVTVDQRNHGKSPHTLDMTYEAMAEDVSLLMDNLQLEEAFHIGHSMGGKMAMKFVDLYPQKVEKLIIVDIAPKAYKPSHTNYFNAFKTLDFKSFNTRKEADLAMENLEKNIGVRQFLLKNLQKEDQGYSLKINVPVIEAFYSDMIGPIIFKKTIPNPTLFVYGSLSDYIKESDIPLIKKDFENVQFKKVEESGHWIHAEKPVETLKIIKDFFC
jgi:pimeloyl-ACP methyl ester carboxylesterase